jgi:hypothetical protein
MLSLLSLMVLGGTSSGAALVHMSSSRISYHAWRSKTRTMMRPNGTILHQISFAMVLGDGVTI